MDWTQYMQAVLALIFVLGLMGVAIFALRRLGFGSPTPTLGHRNKRVRVIEVTAVDARRRLVLVRHDDREHLILLGQNGETIVESRDAPADALPAANDTATDTAANRASPSFSEALGRVIRGGNSRGKAGGGDP